MSCDKERQIPPRKERIEIVQRLEAHLIAALTSGRIAYAGLDVFEGEPKLNPGYLALPNAMLLPHMGSQTTEARDQMGFEALDNLDAFFAGRDLPFPVA